VIRPAVLAAAAAALTLAARGSATTPPSVGGTLVGAGAADCLNLWFLGCDFAGPIVSNVIEGA